MRFTLDHNCLIDLEEERPNARFVRDIIRTTKEGRHRICVPASAGAERLPDGSTARSFSVYQARLERLGLSGAEILFPQMRIDMAFIDYAVVSGPELEALEGQIRQILFPTISDSLLDHVGRSADPKSAAARWHNATMDVDAMWCHIHHGCDAFVTKDGNFLKHSKRSALIALGAKEIAEPEQAARLAESD